MLRTPVLAKVLAKTVLGAVREPGERMREVPMAPSSIPVIAKS